MLGLTPRVGRFAEELGESSCVFKQRQWGGRLEDSVQP